MGGMGDLQSGDRGGSDGHVQERSELAPQLGGVGVGAHRQHRLATLCNRIVLLDEPGTGQQAASPQGPARIAGRAVQRTAAARMGMVIRHAPPASDLSKSAHERV